MVAVYAIGGVLSLLVIGWGARKFVRWLSSGDVAKVELKHAQEKEAAQAVSEVNQKAADGELAAALDAMRVRPPFPRKPNGTP